MIRRCGVPLLLCLAACASPAIPAGAPLWSPPLAALPPARGAIQFACDFSHSPTDCGFFEQAKVPGRATIVNTARTGKTAVRLHTEPGDSRVNGSDDWERNDLALSPEATDCDEGREAWWAHSVLFPNDYVIAPGGAVVMDFHHTGSGGNANFHFNSTPRGLRLHGFGGSSSNPVEYRVELGPLERNVWYDLVYHVRWSSKADGFMTAWMNGKRVLSYRGPTLYRGMRCYLKLAHYHSPTAASSVIHDRILRGTSARAVAIQPLEEEP
jgi:polysaccharide lyase-like protein